MIKTKDEYINSLEKAIKSKEEDNQNSTNELIKCKQLIREQEKIIKRQYTIHEAEKKRLESLYSTFAKHFISATGNLEKI